LLWSTLSEPPDIPPSQPHRETVQVVSRGASQLFLEHKSRHPEPHRNSQNGARSRGSFRPPASHLRPRQVTESANWAAGTGYLRAHPWFGVTKPIRQLIFDSSWVRWMLLVAASGWFLEKQWSRCESYQRLKQFTADASHELRSPITPDSKRMRQVVLTTSREPELQLHRNTAGTTNSKHGSLHSR